MAYFAPFDRNTMNIKGVKIEWPSSALVPKLNKKRKHVDHAFFFFHIDFTKT